MRRRCENDPALPGCSELLAPTPILTIEGYGDGSRWEKYGAIKKYKCTDAGVRIIQSCLVARDCSRMPILLL